MPVVAQITGAVALTALVMGPWWAAVPELQPIPAVVPVTQPVVAKPVVAPHSPVAHQAPARPAHLNLDVRHTFGSLDVSITVDGQPALDARLTGSRKRFKVFGARGERTYRRTLDLAPGARVVRLRVRSPADKLDETRVERFDLAPAAVASVRIDVDKSGLTLVAKRPAPPAVVAAAPPAATPQKAVTAAAATALTLPQAPAAPRPPALAGTLQSMRSILIWIAGFVASTASAFVFEEWLRTRRNKMFPEGDENKQPARRRRAGFAG